MCQSNFCCSCLLGKRLLSCPLLCTQRIPSVVPMPTNTSTNEKFRRRRPKPITCQTGRDDCSHPRQLLGAKNLKLRPRLVNLCPEMSPEPEPTHPRRMVGGALEVHWRQATLHSCPVLQHPAATANVQQHPGLPAPCVPCPRALEVLRLPFTRTHTEPWLQKSSLLKRYASLLPAEKIPPGILQAAHTAAGNSHSSTWLEHRRPALGSHAATAARSASLGGEPGTPPAPTRLRHPAPRCAPARLRRVLRTERGGGLPWGSPWVFGSEAVSWLRFNSLVRALKARPAHLAHVRFCPTGGRT